MSATKTEQPQDETVEILEPGAQNRDVVIGQDPFTRTFTQRPLSFFGKLEVFSVLGGTIERVMSGPDGLTISELFEGQSGLGDSLSDQNFSDADTFFRAIARLATFAPEVFSDLYLVFLAVPRGERELYRELMERPEEEGGLSDEDGAAILETFVDQNWDVMVDFFNSRIVPLFNKISSKVQESQPSKPSKNTRRTTPKA